MASSPERTAERLGVSTATWYRALSDGRFELIHPGVARLPGAATTPEQAIAAAVLAIQGSLASHRSAARLWGIPRPADDPVEVMSHRRTRQPDLDGVIVHRPRDLKDLKPVPQGEHPDDQRAAVAVRSRCRRPSELFRRPSDTS